jgi:hypothetical protein
MGVQGARAQPAGNALDREKRKRTPLGGRAISMKCFACTMEMIANNGRLRKDHEA